MVIHSCFISYHRVEVLRRALASYFSAVSVPFTLVVVDNGSDPDEILPVARWILEQGQDFILLGRNHYPGYACNRGWQLAPPEAEFLHRADNDFAFREGWCEEVLARFEEDPELGQVGLMTDPEEGFNRNNTGGNCVIRRELWEWGLRWDERPWPELPRGYSEDSFFSPAVVALGWRWGRVQRKVIDGLTTPDPHDPYYRETYRSRRIYGMLKQIDA